MPGKSPSDARRAPVQQRSKDTVAAIQEAAIQILMKDGYAHATTVRVAELAGVSVGTLYQYFDGREAVFDAVTAGVLDSLTEAAGAALSASADSTLRRQLHQSVIATLSVLERHPLVLRRLDGIPGSSFRGRLVDARRHAQEIVEAFLVFHQEELRVASLPLAARMLVDFAEGLAYNLREEDDIEVLGAEATRFMYAYLTGADRGTS